MNSRKNGIEFKDVILAVALLGSLWGLFEVAVDEGIRAAGVPFRAGILTGLGMLTMGMVFGLTRKPVTLLLMPVVAIAMKQMTVPLVGATVMCGANSCLAVALQGFAAAGLGAALLGGSRRGLMRGAATGAGAAVVSAVPFYFVGLKLAPCNYLLSFAGAGGFTRFMLYEGLVWAAFSALLFPAGMILAARYGERFSSLVSDRPAVLRGALAGLTAACWAAATLAIMATA
jgi:hypothetical protein